MSRRVLPVDAPQAVLNSSRALAEHLGELIHRCERGVIDTKVAAVVAQLANSLLRALSQIEVVERIERIEQAVATLPGSEAEDVRGELAAVKTASEVR
jgi:hypothetical protein